MTHEVVVWELSLTGSLLYRSSANNRVERSLYSSMAYILSVEVPAKSDTLGEGSDEPMPDSRCRVALQRSVASRRPVGQTRSP